MTLYDLLSAGQYMQMYSVYVTNAFDQNIPISRGTLTFMLAYIVNESDATLFYHLMDKVEYYHTTDDGVMVVFLRDEHFNETADYNYSDDYVKKWDSSDPNTRPYLHGIETEEYTDKWICKFPNWE